MHLLAQATNTKVLGSQILSSPNLDPNLWFNRETDVVSAFFAYVFSASFHTVLITSSVLLSIFFITVMCYCAVRMLELRKKEHAHIHHEIEEYAHHQAQLEKKKQERTDNGSKNLKWNQTLTYLFSQSPADWKLAVIEADSLLEDLLDSMGYKGTGLGEKLKAAGAADFQNVNTAWEVHTIRNKIAHEGSSFELSQHEAKRVIAKYEHIFRSYGFI